ncbi:MAG: L-histidine N(alpha)-methyltransferase [Polyangiales bacterium]
MMVRAQDSLADDVRRHLLATPRSLPPKWFYDELGSRLFDEICDLPEYYLTRAERGLLERHSRAIAEKLPGCEEVVELGSGMARKTGLLLTAIDARVPRLRYVPFDVSQAAIDASARSLRGVLPNLVIEPVVGDFEHDLARMPLSPASRRLFAFLGSTIGNLDERAAPALCAQVAARMRPGDRFLLGVDRVKSVDVLLRAYDDAAGVTARFDKNVLTVMNRLLAGDFDLEAFAHRAHWNEKQSRIEMHLESLVTQRVTLRSIAATIDFDKGERILTEISRKFTRASLEATVAPKLRIIDWIEEDGTFALALLEAR